jgi:hypothetical protein
MFVMMFLPERYVRPTKSFSMARAKRMKWQFSGVFCAKTWVVPPIALFASGQSCPLADAFEGGWHAFCFVGLRTGFRRKAGGEGKAIWALLGRR